MEINHIEQYDPSVAFYNLRDKLSGYVTSLSEDYFSANAARRASIDSVEKLGGYADTMRKGFIDALGGIPYDASLPLDSQTVGVIDEEYLTVEKVRFVSRPGVWVTGSLYIPKNRKKKCGAVLFQCGHSDIGKAFPAYQRASRLIASCGVIVLTMDPIGQGERLSYIAPGVACPVIEPAIDDHKYAGEQCVLVGDSLARYFIADAMKGVDYLLSRDEIDPDSIGLTGNSGGGTATCHMMVCDGRIKAAAPGTFVTSREEYIYSGGAQDSEQIWYGATARGFDHHEVFACFAPKPAMILSVDSDFFPKEGTLDVYENSRRLYSLFGCENNIRITCADSLHGYAPALAKAAGSFFAEVLNGETRTPVEDAVRILTEEELNVTRSGQVLRDFPESKTVFDFNLERYMSFVPAYDTEKAKSFIIDAVNTHRKPSRKNVRRLFGDDRCCCGLLVNSYLWFSQPQLPTYMLSFRSVSNKNRSDAVVCLWDKGTDDIEGHFDRIMTFCNEWKQVFVVDVSGIGKCAPADLNACFGKKARFGALDRLTKDMFFIGDSLCALRLFELEQTLDVLRTDLGFTGIYLYAEQKSSVLAKLLALVHEDIPVEINNGFSFAETVRTRYYNDYNISSFLLPEILRYTDI